MFISKVVSTPLKFATETVKDLRQATSDPRSSIKNKIKKQSGIYSSNMCRHTLKIPHSFN
jgi:hypothetical protein